MPDLGTPADALRWALQQLGIGDGPDDSRGVEGSPTVPSAAAPGDDVVGAGDANSPVVAASEGADPAEAVWAGPAPSLAAMDASGVAPLPRPLGRPPAAGLVNAGLTVDQIKSMTPAQINAEWDRVKEVLQRQGEGV